MVMKHEFDSEFIYDVNSYLLENFPRMPLADRRAICALCLSNLDAEDLEAQIFNEALRYAEVKANWGYEEPTDEEESSDD